MKDIAIFSLWLMSFENTFMDNAPSKSKQDKELEGLLEEKQKLLITQNQQFLEELFQQNSTRPVRLSSIQINNSTDFRVNFLNKQFQPLVDQQQFTLTEFFERIEKVSKNLTKVNILENLLIQIDAAGQSPRFFQNLSQRDSLNLVANFNLFPVKRFYAKTGSNIGNGEGDGYIQFQFKNIFGGGENLSFDATTGTRTSSSYLLNYNMPVNNNTSYIWENLFFVNTRAVEWLSSETKNFGINTKIFTKYDGKVNHSLGLDNIWRILDNKSSKSTAVLSQSGDNFKTSINYNVSYDSRDNIHLPLSGSFLRYGVELSGLSKISTNHFIKQLVEAQFASKLNDSNSIIITNKFGILNSINKPSFVLDRFFIGGPNDVRSFTLNGLGPKSYGNSLGGDLFLNGGVSLISRIPYTPKDTNFKFHNFINYGNLQLYNQSIGLKQNLNSLFRQFSVSYGFGLLYNHPMARFELNFVLPLSAHQNDSTRKGLQYGIGVSFL